MKFEMCGRIEWLPIYLWWRLIISTRLLKLLLLLTIWKTHKHRHGSYYRENWSLPSHLFGVNLNSQRNRIVFTVQHQCSRGENGRLTDSQSVSSQRGLESEIRTHSKTHSKQVHQITFDSYFFCVIINFFLFLHTYLFRITNDER